VLLSWSPRAGKLVNQWAFVIEGPSLTYAAQLADASVRGL
jgi:hypothetical protein